MGSFFWDLRGENWWAYKDACWQSWGEFVPMFWTGIYKDGLKIATKYVISFKVYADMVQANIEFRVRYGACDTVRCFTLNSTLCSSVYPCFEVSTAAMFPGSILNVRQEKRKHTRIRYADSQD